jgi:hypothetical protein
MPSQSKEQRGTMERVMHEYKEGELRTGRGKGPKVKSRKQAIAIGLHESGATNQESAAKNKANLARSKSKERKGQTAEAEKEGKRAQGRTVAKGESRARGSSTSSRSTSSRSAASRSSRSQEPTKAELYERAKKRKIEGRSKMSKEELERALAH